MPVTVRTISTCRPARRRLRARSPPIAARTGKPSPPATMRTMIVDWTTTFSPQPRRREVRPVEGEAGVAEGRDAVEDGREETPPLGDQALRQVPVEDGGARRLEAEGHERDLRERRPGAAEALLADERLEARVLPERPPREGEGEERRERHDPEAAGLDEGEEDRVPERRESGPRVDDRQPRHRGGARRGEEGVHRGEPAAVGRSREEEQAGPGADQEEEAREDDEMGLDDLPDEPPAVAQHPEEERDHEERLRRDEPGAGEIVRVRGRRGRRATRRPPRRPRKPSRTTIQTRTSSRCERRNARRSSLVSSRRTPRTTKVPSTSSRSRRTNPAISGSRTNPCSRTRAPTARRARIRSATATAPSNAAAQAPVAPSAAPGPAGAVSSAIGRTAPRPSRRVYGRPDPRNV